MPALPIGMAIGTFLLRFLWLGSLEFPEAGPERWTTLSSPSATHVHLDWNQIHEERHKLEQAKVELRLSCQALDHITVRLVVADITLPQAVELAEPLLRRRVGFPGCLTTYWSGLSYRQAIARFLIQRAENMYADTDPSFWHPTLHRLEREYATFE